VIDLWCCFVCGATLGPTLLHLPGPQAITSLGHVIDAETRVYQCLTCSHVQTRPLDDVADYYDANYNIRSESEGEDDLYEVRDGQPVYRSQHQARIVLSTHPELPRGARVLDFGCAKAASLRQVLEVRPDLEAHVFDVSTNYKRFWDEFVRPENQATHHLRPEWDSYFDLVLSFFALEHVADPRAFVDDLARTVKPGGRLHLVFPNVYANVVDMIVVDHINHFSRSSIEALFQRSGLTILTIDTTLHNAAHVVIAERSLSAPPPPSDDAEARAASIAEARSVAEFWQGARDNVLGFEAALPPDQRCAIYGSGVYGIFIATTLRSTVDLAYFIDQNPHQQTKTILGKAVVAPTAVGEEIDVVYVGLNPRAAQRIIASVPALHVRERQFFYL
jgi:SAM-dependent methyltransferase